MVVKVFLESSPLPSRPSTAPFRGVSFAPFPPATSSRSRGSPSYSCRRHSLPIAATREQVHAATVLAAAWRGHVLRRNLRSQRVLEEVRTRKCVMLQCFVRSVRARVLARKLHDERRAARLSLNRTYEESVKRELIDRCGWQMATLRDAAIVLQRAFRWAHGKRDVPLQLAPHKTARANSPPTFRRKAPFLEPTPEPNRAQFPPSKDWVKEALKNRNLDGCATVAQCAYRKHHAACQVSSRRHVFRYYYLCALIIQQMFRAYVARQRFKEQQACRTERVQQRRAQYDAMQISRVDHQLMWNRSHAEKAALSIQQVWKRRVPRPRT